MIPRWFLPVGIITLCLALVPFAIVAKIRSTKSTETRPQIIFDMDQQPKFKAQAVNGLFADGRAMRPRVPGTIPRGELQEDDHLYRGKTGGEWATDFPMEVTSRMMQRGRERYDIFCLPCHGYTGDGNGIVSQRAESLREGIWIPPLSYHSDVIRSKPVGNLFNTISNGIRSMPAYGTQIGTEDRWAIVAYIRALQRSQNATIDDVPAAKQSKLR